MSLYPSLEDMKVDQLQRAQAAVASTAPDPVPGYAMLSPTLPSGDAHALYPSLDSYMGLDLTPRAIEQNMPGVSSSQQVAVREASNAARMQVAPVTGAAVGVARAEIKQGVRPVLLCKDQDGKMGLRVRAVNKGVFVAFVYRGSPAALAGLRFGDQILQINGETVAGWDTDKVTKFLKKASPQSINMAIRDRPFERTLTLQKDSVGHVGFVFKENKITAIVKDSSAARNGLLTDHHLVEVDGQNVVGLKEKEIAEIFDRSANNSVTVTVIPSYIYEHIVKSMGSSLIKKYMDHSIPDL